jgi:hypothetical protein
MMPFNNALHPISPCGLLRDPLTTGETDELNTFLPTAGGREERACV